MTFDPYPTRVAGLKRVLGTLSFLLLAASLPYRARDSLSAQSPEPSLRSECASIPSAILGRPVNYCVVFPNDYDSANSTRYPTLYFLHGLFENERSWIERGGLQVLEELLRQGQLGKFLVVLPDGGKTFYVNSYDGHERYEDFFVGEFIPAIDKKYRTIAKTAARGISGVSMGGYGALHLAMRHSQVFGSASAHSAALLPRIPDPIPTEGRWGFYARVLQGPFGSPLNTSYWDLNSPLTLAEHPERFSHLKLYLDCGDQDRYGFEEGAHLLHRELEAKGFTHEFALRPGGHGWSYLNQYLKYSLLFHWHLFEQAGNPATAGPSSASTSSTRRRQL
jgi:S-formylglutathione hydrolase FrmB